MSFLHRLMADLPMNRKLGYGFGCVILFTLLGNLYGLNSRDQLIDTSQRQNQFAEAARLAETIPTLQLRFDKDPRSEHREQLIELQKRISELLERARHGDAAMDGQINESLRQLGEIDTAFDALVAARASREQSRQVMIGNGNQAMAALTELEQQIDAAMRANSADTSLYSQNRALGDLVKRILETRYLVRGFVFQHTQSSFDLAMPGFQRALDQAATLRSLLPAHHIPYLDRLRESLTLYRQGIESFKQGLEQTARAQEALLAHQNQAVENIARLNQEARARMEVQQSITLRATMAFTLLAITMGILAATLIYRQVTEPLRQTLEFTQQISAGNLHADTQSTRKDEFGDLQNAMHDMRTGLRALVGNIEQSVAEIATSSKRLSNLGEQTSSGARIQLQETEQVATAVNEMAATVQEVARNAALAAEASSHAEQQALSGQQVVSSAVRQIERMAEQTDRSFDTMQRLQQNSQAIGSVLDVIKTVAEQTNLLALNAAIEAARAGEAGRGFAVVADEVRGLAQRTQQSTREIEELIATLQQAASHAGVAMEESRSLTESTVKLAREAGQALDGITTQVAQLQDMSQQIAAAAEEQSAVAEEINRRVTQVHTISEQTASASQQTAESTLALAQLGQQLSQVTHRFQL